MLDMVAALGETTAGPALPRLRDRMLETAEGRQILRERPRVNSSTVDMQALSALPEGTFGRSYITWLDRCGVTPDTREPVREIFRDSRPACLEFPSSIQRACISGHRLNGGDIE